MGMEYTELALALEERFGIRVPPAQMERIDTVGDAQEMVLALLREAKVVYVLDQICDVIAGTGNFVTELDRKTLRPEMRLIEDLGWG
jgi:hypothetical protein